MPSNPQQNQTATCTEIPANKAPAIQHAWKSQSPRLWQSIAGLLWIAGALVAGISMHVAERITHQSRRTVARNSSNSTLLSPALPALPYQQCENGTPRLAEHHMAGPSLSNSWLDGYRSRSQDRQQVLDLYKDDSASTNAGRMAETPHPDGAHKELHEACNLVHILCSDPRGKEGTQEFLNCWTI